MKTRIMNSPDLYKGSVDCLMQTVWFMGCGGDGERGRIGGEDGGWLSKFCKHAL